MRDVLADQSIKQRIQNDVNDGMEKTQREFLLRQQLAAIRKELGEGTDGESVVEEYRAKIAESAMPDKVRETVERELDRFERTNEQSPEHGWIRTWLDTVTEVPWGKRSDDNLDVTEARSILDADHTGPRRREEPDRRVPGRPQAAGRPGLPASVGRGSGAIIALVGPPGVGKTSLGESVARALGREFVRVSLGGVRDEAEIRGHRRTYVGAMPGRIVRALKEAGTMNPVFLLDEVDKLGSDWRGDPSSALLEVLDPAQNHTFRDHYLEVDLDLSEVLFIATANVADTIPGPLLDRMEIIPLDGYTEEEKVTIAVDHLLERQLERNGLSADEVSVTTDALRSIVSGYTREAGVRNLERELGKTLRKVATRLASGDLVAPIVIDEGDVRTYLGRQKFFFEAADRTAVPGVATGLAVTGMGGDVLFIEASRLPSGEGQEGAALTITGQLGDVMKESAQIALSYVRSHAEAARCGGGRSSPPARSRRRHPQGRPVGRHHHGLRSRQPDDGPAAAVERGDDRRGHPAGPGAAHRWRQAEGAGCVPGRAEGDHPAQAQRARPRRRAGGRAGGDDLPPGRRRHPGAGAGPRAGRRDLRGPSRRLVAPGSRYVECPPSPAGISALRASGRGRPRPCRRPGRGWCRPRRSCRRRTSCRRTPLP